MLKVLAYIEDRGSFEYIAVSESGRLAARTQNPLAQVPEIQDLERVMKAKLEAADPKPDGLAELVEEIHQYNETVSSFERVRYVKTITPEVAQALVQAIRSVDATALMKRQEALNTVIDGHITLIKVEKDGE